MSFLFDLPTIALNANDARALSDEEIRNYQTANYAAMQQAQNLYSDLSLLNATANIKGPERPLDERFSTFKTKLAAAVAKYQL